MTPSFDSVLVLGGGVAGMAAAKTLGDRDVTVHLVETADRLGGHAASWACMATDVCRHCGACLAQDMAHQTALHPNISVHLNTTLDTLEKTGQGFDIRLTSGETIPAARIIMATGFSPFDPAPSLLPGLHFTEHDRIITTAQLNQMLKADTLTDFLGNTPAPKIAFIQCVGSRNRQLQRDFCSQVCCKISLRHTRKLLHLLPDAAITLFHMDLQTIGKETRCLAADLSAGIDMVQGVPAEILEDRETGKMRMVTEDPGTRSRVARSFDLVVLSVGMAPSPELAHLTSRLGITPNLWGFFNTQDAVLPDGIHAAGCAAGPKDILGSRQEGRIAAARVLAELKQVPADSPDVLVWGDGPQAATIAQTLADNGHKAFCFGQGTAPAGVNLLDPDRILGVDGAAGCFTVWYEQAGRRKSMTCRAIIAAPEPEYKTVAGQERLAKAITLEDFAKIPADQLPDASAILLDYTGPEFKTGARLALTSAMAAQHAGRQVTVVMNKMLVHGAAGQQLYDRARKAGVRFLRVNTPADIQIQKTDTGFCLILDEATLPGIPVTVSCNTLVIPSAPVPGTDFGQIAGLLKQKQDTEGFLQSPNVRHRLTKSPRKGIYFAGTCHDEVDDTDLATELNAIMADLDFSGPAPDHGVEVSQKKCARCLTCLRICPHHAILLNDKARPEIVADACFGCHLCVANCPAFAITSETFSTNQVADQVQKDRVVVLACRRSAALAAGPLDLGDHIQLIPVPCACRASTNLVLKSLINGAQKVIIAGCHEDNCLSMDGSTTAQREVAQVLAMPGITPDKVSWHPVAANETQTFARIISDAHIS
ncbi:MAG: FAD-dependent oxidoreductase [Desulfotignum sp.]|jgi:heterodisulfide reductase subunit A|nr:FAD-dependent oxidoreductase [Desulfotignum sp.]